MKQLPPFPLGAALVLATLVASGPLTAHEADQGKPSLTLKASPAVAFSPARIVLVAELRGGPNDYEQYYCPGIEWEWGDGTTSENVEDCEPFEPGKSEIRRRWTAEHVYRTAGNYRVVFRLKRRDKTLTIANTRVQIRPGFREPGDAAR